MSAREKLNVAYFNGVLILSTVAGLVSGSWLLFGAVFTFGLARGWYLGNIRPGPRRRS